MLELSPSERAIVQARAEILNGTRDRVEAQVIIDEVAAIFGLTPAEVVVRSRRPLQCEAHQLVAYLLRERGWALVDIGRVLAREHSSISHSITKIRRSLPLMQRSQTVA